ncbi:MAG: hypothetical protein WB755_25745, partial [Terriglobales bacterium]
ALNQIQVPVGRWIKRAGIDGDDLLQSSSFFLTGCRQAWVKEDSMRQDKRWQFFRAQEQRLQVIPSLLYDGLRVDVAEAFDRKLLSKPCLCSP